MLKICTETYKKRLLIRPITISTKHLHRVLKSKAIKSSIKCFKISLMLTNCWKKWKRWNNKTPMNFLPATSKILHCC